MILGPLLTLPVAAMRTTARMLRVLADTGELLAAVLQTADTNRRQAPRPQSAPSAPRTATPAPAVTPEPVESDDPATLAARTAPQVIAALDGLSTAALAEL